MTLRRHPIRRRAIRPSRPGAGRNRARIPSGPIRPASSP